MPPKRAQRSRSRQITPQSPPKQNASYVSSPRQSHRETRSRSHDAAQTSTQGKRPAKSLAAVTEESNDADEIEVVQFSSTSDDEVVVHALDDPDLSDSIDDTSSNGTTQLEAIDLDLVVDSLPTLSQSASQILSLFEKEDRNELIRDLNSPLSKLSRRLRNYVAVLNTSREALGAGSYIDTSLILQKLAQEHASKDGPWKPDAILQHANLALFAASLARSDETATYDILERMFNTFPEPFGHFYLDVSKPSHSTQLIRETVAFGISLRTQFFLRVIEMSRNDASFDPDSILEKVFYDEDGKINGFQAEGEEMLPEVEKAVINRINNIRKSFKDSSTSPIDLDQLQSKYPWHRFLSDAFHWIHLRGNELNTQILAQGGVTAIQSRLENKDFSSYDHSAPSAPATPGAQEPTSTSSAQHPPTRKDFTSPLPQSARLPTSILASRVSKLKVIQRQNEEVSDEEGEEEDDDDDDDDESDSESESVEDGDDNDKAEHGDQTVNEASSDDEDEEEGGDDDNDDSDEEDGDGEERETTAAEEEQQRPLTAPKAQLKVTPNRPRSAVTEIPQSPDVPVVANAEPDIEHHIVMDNDEDENDNVDGELEEEGQPELAPPRPTQGSILPTQRTLAVLEVAREQAALGNKENIDTTRRSYNDRQVNAKRIDWNESQAGQKRGRSDPDEENESEESDNFEVDARPRKKARLPRQPPPDAADDFIAGGEDDDVDQQASQQLHNDDIHSSQLASRHRPPPSTQPPPQRRSNDNSSRVPTSSAPQPRQNNNRHPQPQSQARRSSQAVRHESISSTSVVPVEETFPGSTAEEYRTINAQAKATMRLRPILDMTYHDSNFKGQIRRPWTTPEINRLFDLIAEHGCHWARILTEDMKYSNPALQQRTQVQLKDKARNLKMDYLKAGSELPEGFANVTIKNSDKALLTAMGLPY